MNIAPKRVLDMRKTWAEGDALRDKDNITPSDITKVIDILYKTCEDNKELKLDVYYPYKAKDLLPVVFNIHGGGYFYGDKELYRFLCMSLADRGVCVVNIDYRLSPEYRFPEALFDINDALIWVSENISRFYGDSNKIMLIGDSAGAQLASHYGAIYSNPEFAALYNMKTANVKIVALSLACGFYDLAKRVSADGLENIMLDYLGEDFNIQDERVQVFKYINKNYPPSYVFSGIGDFLVDQPKPFCEFLNSKGVECEYKIYEGLQGQDLGHVFHCNMQLKEASYCNDDQINFLFNIIKKIS